jgi:beta-N-acetylhexosaminidase
MSLIARGAMLTLVTTGAAFAASPAASAERASSPSVATVGASPACAEHVLEGLSRRQRIGQLFLLGIAGGADASLLEAIQQHHVGSVTYAAFVTSGTEAIKAAVDQVQALATDTATGRIGFLVAANQEGGRIQALSGPGFTTMPSAVEQGTMTRDDLRTQAAGWGRDLVSAGINLDLAPVGDTVPTADVTTNAPIGQLDRDYGNTPEVVEEHIRAFIEGMRDAKVLTTVKHFPGMGRVLANTDYAAAVKDTVTTPDDPYLRPYQAAVELGVPFVMVALASYEHLDGDTLAAFSKPIVTGILRERFGFDGVVVSDDLSAVAVQAVAPGDRALRFLRAGGDMLTVTNLDDATAMITTLVDESTSDRSFEQRLDESVLRIQRAKESAGLLPCP